MFVLPTRPSADARSPRTPIVLAALVTLTLAGSLRAQGPQTPPPPPPPSAPAYRSLDGTGNNPVNPTWGSANTNYLRERSGARYADALNAPAGATRPSARAISNALADQANTDTADERGLSTCVYEWGQFLDHDLGLAQGGTTEAFNIPVPAGDPWFDPAATGSKFISMKRSAFTGGTTAPRQQINTVSAFIDASHVYAVDSARADWLRVKTGGLLRTRSTPVGELLPLNTAGWANDNPVGADPATLIVAGDVRANEQPGLTTLHTVFVREHNWHARRLAALNPAWNDERLYQEARRLVAAEMQFVTYNEFLPALLGRPLPPYRGYQPAIQPGISNTFATSAYRLGHSMVGFDIGVVNDRFLETDSFELDAVFFNPNPITALGVDPFVRYFAVDTMQRVDNLIVDPLRNFLFGPPGAGGFDLAALNIQRGRDHGLPDYNTCRADFGLPRLTSFAQITRRGDVAAKLAATYASIDDLDPWVGMLAEDHLPGACVGPTIAAALTDQFTRLRDADRFWYQNDRLSPADMNLVESSPLSVILQRTTGVTGLQRNIFLATNLACRADYTNDGVVSSDDLVRFQRDFFAGDPRADLNADGRVSADDYVAYLTAYMKGCAG